MRQSVKRRRPLARQETEAHFAGPSGQGGLLLVACGALARELVDIQRQFPEGGCPCLPASWHNHPEKLFLALDARWMLRCAPGVMSRLSMVIAGLAANWMPIWNKWVFPHSGAHCYEMFLGKPVFDDEMDNALGTFFLLITWSGILNGSSCRG